MAAAPPDDQECSLFEATCRLKKGAGDIVSGLAGSAIDQAAESFAKSAVKLYQFLVTFWVNPEVDGIDFGRLFSPRISDNSDDPTYFLAYHTGWLVTWVAVLGLLLAAGRMAWQRRGEPFREAMSGMVTLVVVVFAVTQAVNLALAAGDAYSTWIIDASTSGDVKGNVGKVGATLWGGGAGMGAGLVLIVSLLAILSGVVQLALMLVRGAMLVLLVGALPLAAAASITSDGRSGYRKMAGWLIAFILYKPVAATVYAVAFKALMGDSIAQVQGIVLSVLAVAVLPALMRFITPMVGAVGGGGGSAVAALSPALATGARMVPTFGGGQSSGGGSSSSSPAPRGSDSSRGPAGSGQPGGQGSPGRSGGSGQPGQHQGRQGQGGTQQPSGSGAGRAPVGTSSTAGGAAGGAAGGGAAAGAAGGPWGAVAGAAANRAQAVRRGAHDVASGASRDEEGPRGSSR